MEAALGMQDVLHNLADGAAATGSVGHEVDAGQDSRMGIPRRGGETRPGEGREVLDVVADKGDLLRREAQLAAGLFEDRSLVQAVVPIEGNGKLRRPLAHDLRATAGDDPQLQAESARHLEPEPVAGVKALAFRGPGGSVPRFESAVGEDAVHVQQDRPNPPGAASGVRAKRSRRCGGLSQGMRPWNDGRSTPAPDVRPGQPLLPFGHPDGPGLRR